MAKADRYNKLMQTIESVVGKPHLVTQHNSLVRAKYNYTQREIKVTRLITSKVNPFRDYVPGTGLVVEVEPAEAKAIFAAEGKTYHSIWKDFRQTVANLNKKPITIDTANVEGDIYWTQSCVRDKHTGKYRVRLTEDITPLVAALKGGNFTSIPLTIYSEFKSKYLSRLYEVMYSYRSMRGGVVKFNSWLELAQQVGWTGKVYGHFKNRVLKEAEQVFPKKTILSIEIEEIKRPGSRAVEGLRFTITTRNPTKKSEHSLFPELSDNYEQAAKEVRHQLIAWSVDELVIEKLISDPFQYIKDEKEREKLRGAYTTPIDYLWEKMDYVGHANDVKQEAAYLIKAIQHNYTSKKQKKAKKTNERKEFEKQKAADITDIEVQISNVRNQSILMRAEIISQMFEEDANLMESTLTIVAQNNNRKETSIEELNQLFSKRGFFRIQVLTHMQSAYPGPFKKIDITQQERLKELQEKLQKVKQREMTRKV